MLPPHRSTRSFEFELPTAVQVSAAGHATADSLLDEDPAGLGVRWMRQLLPQRRKPISDECVIGSMACMLGGVILARAVNDKEASAILGACREFLHQQRC